MEDGTISSFSPAWVAQRRQSNWLATLRFLGHRPSVAHNRKELRYSREVVEVTGQELGQGWGGWKHELEKNMGVRLKKKKKGKN